MDYDTRELFSKLNPSSIFVYKIKLEAVETVHWLALQKVKLMWFFPEWNKKLISDTPLMPV